MGLHQGFTLDSVGGVVYSIPRPSIELDTYVPMAFNQFVTPANVLKPSIRYFDHCTIFLINKFCPSPSDKILKEDN